MKQKRVLTNQIVLGETNRVCGYIESLRDKKSMAFIVLKDINGRLQVTVDKNFTPQLADIVKSLTLDAFIGVTGKAVQNDYVKLGGCELVAEEIEVFSTAAELPFTRLEREGGEVKAKGNINEAEYDLRMDNRWIDLRTEANQLIFKVQTVMNQALRNYLLEKGFIEIHSPKISGAESESGAGVFEVDYFDRKGYLVQSPQFYKQMAMASGFDRIFEVGPVFRAEKSHTSRHTTEFTGFDLELSYIDSYHDLMTLEGGMLTHMLKEVKAAYGADILRIFGKEVIVPSEPFPVMTLAEIYAELEARYGFTIDESQKGDLTTEAERLCGKLAQEKFGSEFLFATDFRPEKRAFYHMRKDGMPEGFDLIWRGCEITTGAQREHRYEILKAQADERGLGKDVAFYLDFFKYGCPPHGGFGIGLDRLTMLLLGLSIKDSMFIFRGPDRLAP